MGTRNGSGAYAGSRISVRESVEVVAGEWNGVWGCLGVRKVARCGRVAMSS